ncbi:RNA-binding protein 1 [Selaginella moellendorffii]|nr:RNA-binding protein 1 [Selaginella moellendorffii]|eukprot:XP_002990011.2 RNA-binding protein 1 [Selaginella moellendorffii]
MTDFTANWHFGSDRREDLTPSKSSYGTSRTAAGGLRDLGGYSSRDLAYEDLAAHAAYDSLGAGSSLLRNGLYQGLTTSELVSLTTGTGGLGVLGASGLGGVLDDQTLLSQGARLGAYDFALGRLGLPGPQDQDVLRGGPDILPPEASATLFVDGLPIDCTRREAAHIFRPFIGFKEVRVVHKDAKRAVGEKIVLCFVEFADPRCAATALEALQGYKFDENDPDSYVLRLTFARYPGPRGAGARDRSPYRGRDRSPRRDRRH